MLAPLLFVIACSSEGSSGFDGPVLIDVSLVDGGFSAPDASPTDLGGGEDSALLEDAASIEDASSDLDAEPEDAPLPDAEPAKDIGAKGDAEPAKDGPIDAQLPEDTGGPV